MKFAYISNVDFGEVQQNVNMIVLVKRISAQIRHSYSYDSTGVFSSVKRFIRGRRRLLVCRSTNMFWKK